MNMGGGEAAGGQLITVFVQHVCTLKLPGLLSGLLIARHPVPIMLVLGALKQLPAVYVLLPVVGTAALSGSLIPGLLRSAVFGPKHAPELWPRCTEPLHCFAQPLSHQLLCLLC